MMRWCGLALALGMVLTGAPAQAGPCDRFSNPFQYNDCLANLAPRRKVKTRGGGGDPEKNVRGARRRGSVKESGFAGASGGWVSLPGGRVQTTIDPWADKRGNGEHRAKRRRR